MDAIGDRQQKRQAVSFSEGDRNILCPGHCDMRSVALELDEPDLSACALDDGYFSHGNSGPAAEPSNSAYIDFPIRCSSDEVSQSPKSMLSCHGSKCAQPLRKQIVKRPASISTSWPLDRGLADSSISRTPAFVRTAVSCLASTPRAVSNFFASRDASRFTSNLLEREGSPVAIHRSRSRLVCAGGIKDEVSGTRKLLIRLIVNESKSTLTSLCGNGRLRGLRMNIFTDVCNVLERDPDLVQIKDICSSGANQTVIEIVVEPLGLHWDVEVEQMGKQLTEQVELNHGKPLEQPSSNVLASLISHFEIDDHICACNRNQHHWRALFVVAVVLFASGSAAWSGTLPAPTLGLRSSPFSSPSHPPAALGKSLGKLPLGYGLVASRRRSPQPTMMEPLSTTIYGAAILSSLLSSQENLTALKLAGDPTRLTRLVKVAHRSDRGWRMASAAQGAAIGMAVEGVVTGARSTRTLVRATSTLLRKGATSAAEKRLLEEEFPAESAFIDDAATDAAELLLDWGDRTMADAAHLFASKGHLLEAVADKGHSALNTVCHAQAALPLGLFVAAAVATPFIPLAYKLMLPALKPSRDGVSR